MDIEEKVEAIREVILWVKTNKQSPLNGIEEIEFILDRASESNDIHNVSECMESECNSKRYWHFIYCEHHARRKKLI